MKIDKKSVIFSEHPGDENPVNIPETIPDLPTDEGEILEGMRIWSN